MEVLRNKKYFCDDEGSCDAVKIRKEEKLK
jgi:hypothetical protein